MARQPRSDAPGAIHHVMLRGIEKRPIFADDRDRRELVRRIGLVFPECDVACYAWALMPNHVHAVVRTGARPLAVAMARLGTGYAGHFNRRHHRVGHLFQNRYKAARVADDDHLRSVIRYVHRNPLRAGIVSDVAALEEYPWTGHGALLGVRRPIGFENVRFVRRLLADAGVQGRAAIRAWMGELSEAGAGAQSHLAVRRELDALVRWVVDEYGVSRRELLGGRRGSALSAARAVIAHLACAQGIPQTEVGAAVGVSQAAAARARARGRSMLERASPGRAAGRAANQRRNDRAEWHECPQR
jgi:REP element-mobilizing transposase RayT